MDYLITQQIRKNELARKSRHEDIAMAWLSIMAVVVWAVSIYYFV